jgi:uncharacterized protein
MRILIDIGHPAHVHFFKGPMRLLKENGHEILVTSRVKEIAVELLDELGIEHKTLSTMGKGGAVALLKELFVRNTRLYQEVKRFKPDVMAEIGGIFVAHVGTLSGIPSLAFYDTENAKLQNALTYPFASCVIVPSCYQTWLPGKRHIRYSGYHELSYLAPNYFTPDREIALANGLSEQDDTFLLRTVSWQANHDIGENAWSTELLEHLVSLLVKHGKVLISSEVNLPENLSRYRYEGNPAQMHHVMAFCRGYIGESATMASECAVLGVPAVYAAETGRGYTDEQEKKYGLVKNVRELNWANIEEATNWMLSMNKETISTAKENLLKDTIDVSKFVVECIETFPAPLKKFQEGITVE